MKILITSGATREPIDDVRFLSNVSTGGTGARLADTLAARGHAVTLLRGEAAVLPRTVADVRTFGSTDDLGRQLADLLGTGAYDAVIHCAAVSDYRPEHTRAGKLTSYASELVLRLVPTPKLLPTLKHSSPRPLLVVGFKLTSGAGRAERVAAVNRVFASGTVDFVVHNDLQDRAAVGDARAFRAFRAGDIDPEHLDGLDALAAWLDRMLAPAPKMA